MYSSSSSTRPLHTDLTRYQPVSLAGKTRAITRLWRSLKGVADLLWVKALAIQWAFFTRLLRAGKRWTLLKNTRSSISFCLACRRCWSSSVSTAVRRLYVFVAFGRSWISSLRVLERSWEMSKSGTDWLGESWLSGSKFRMPSRRSSVWILMSSGSYNKLHFGLFWLSFRLAYAHMIGSLISWWLTYHLKNRDFCDIRFPLVSQPGLGHISPNADTNESIIDIMMVVPGNTLRSQPLFLIICCRFVSFSMWNLPWFIFSSPGRSLKSTLSMASNIYSWINMREIHRTQLYTYLPITKVLVRKVPLPTQCVFEMDTVRGRERHVSRWPSLSVQGQDSWIDLRICLTLEPLDLESIVE